MARGRGDHVLPDDDRTLLDPEHLVRRYTPVGNVAHLIHETDWQKPLPHALCGWWGDAYYWRGTGGQHEYERAAELPTCQKCQMWVKP